MSIDGFSSRQRSSVILDAGYVSMRPAAMLSSPSIVFGLHGPKLICVLAIALLLVFVSFINLTCLLWIMYQLDWSPFHSVNGSQVFRYDPLNKQIEFYEQSMFDDAIYTTRMNSSQTMHIQSSAEIDIFGDQNSIFLNPHRISISSDKFLCKNQSSINFFDLQSYKFDPQIKTKLRLHSIRSQHIHHKNVHAMASDHLAIRNVNRLFVSSQNLSLETNQRDHRSTLRFSNPMMVKQTDHRIQKTSSGNLNFRAESILLDLPKFAYTENPSQTESTIYRLCICNTTLLLLRSFAHQPCPLC